MTTLAPELTPNHHKLYDLVQQSPVTHFFSNNGHTVFLKDETVQSNGSFKLRGPLNKLRNVEENEPELLHNGVYTASIGNHGQGVALASTYYGLTSHVYLPRGAAPKKVEAIQNLGGKLKFVNGTVDDALEQAQKDCVENNGLFIHPFDDYDVIAGNSSIGYEIVDDDTSFDTVFVPVGGGGLLAGVCQALDARSSATKVFGVQLEGSNSFTQSVAARRVVELSEVNNLSDGTAVKRAGALALSTVLESPSFAGMVEVSNQELAAALQRLDAESDVVTEMAAGLSLAGVNKCLHSESLPKGNHLALLTGKHRDQQRFENLLSSD